MIHSNADFSLVGILIHNKLHLYSRRGWKEWKRLIIGVPPENYKLTFRIPFTDELICAAKKVCSKIFYLSTFNIIVLNTFCKRKALYQVLLGGLPTFENKSSGYHYEGFRILSHLKMHFVWSTGLGQGCLGCRKVIRMNIIKLHFH